MFEILKYEWVNLPGLKTSDHGQIFCWEHHLTTAAHACDDINVHYPCA